MCPTTDQYGGDRHRIPAVQLAVAAIIRAIGAHGHLDGTSEGAADSGDKKAEKADAAGLDGA